MPDLVQIDGGRGEGGGQVLRSALALSVITGRPFHIRAIRSRRKPPGLAPQHLHALRAFRELSAASCRGDEEGSREVVFEPQRVRPGSYEVDIRTAGSVTLVLQALALPLALADGASELVLRGGTHVPGSPPFNYIESCWLPFMRRLGLEMDVDLDKAGFFPRGGGQISARIQGGVKLGCLQLLKPGALRELEIVSAASDLPAHVRQRQAARARSGVQATGHEASVQLLKLEAASPGSVVAITGRFDETWITTSALGGRGKSAEAVGEEAAAQFRFFLERPGAVEERLADQIVLPLALASGASEFTTVRVTEHLRTNVDVIKAFVERPIELEGKLGQPGRFLVR